MNSLQLFTHRIPELENLPLKPKIFFYPSAGFDFRGCVAFTNYRIQHESKNHGRGFNKPELFVYTCIGNEVLELKAKLAQGEVELMNDQYTTIVARNYKTLELRSDIIFEINRNYIDCENLNLGNYQTNTAFYFELLISGENYSETQKILYFEAENIDFFNKIILSNIFKTNYLCTTREGIGWGGCKKSVIDYIYKDNYPLFFTTFGFKPEINILFNDFTKDLFDSAVLASEILDVNPYYGNYISESQRFINDSVIYKINYLT